MASKEAIYKAMTFVETAYPNFFRTLSDNMISGMTNTWAEMFADTDEKLFIYAIKTFVANDTKGFPPNIGQINDIIRKAQNPPITEIEAWEMVKRAMRESYDLESARREWNKLPEDVRSPIRPADLREWGSLDSNIVNNTISASYRRSFVTKQKYAEEFKAIPQSVRNLLPVKRIEE